MDIKKDEAFELAFSKTNFYKGMVESLKNKDCPFESVFEIRNGKYRSSYVQLSHEIWQAAKAQAVPEGFVLVPKDNLSVFWQDSDEPENFCSSEADFNCLGDCIDIGEIMEINKFTQANINKEELFGTWFAEAINPTDKANFFVGTKEECEEIVQKNKAMIEAQEPAND